MRRSDLPVRVTEAMKLARLWSRVGVGPRSACWPWRGAFFSNGYGAFNWRGKVVRAHRVAYELFFGVEIHAEKVAMHKCDNPACCNPLHIEIGNTDDNVRDRDSKERQARGERIATAKLCAEDIQRIRRDPRQQRVIANEYGVSKSLIGNIKRGESWRHVS